MKPFEKPIYVTRPMLANLDDVNKEIHEIWESQWLTNSGAKHQKLEEDLKKLLKVRSLSLFNNGTIALIVAVQSLRLSGEVITTPFTFPATPHVLAWNNITPVFCDVDESTLTIDAEKIEGMITSKTTGILGVHVYGMPCNMNKIQKIADRYGLKVIYDAAHAFNTEIDGVGIGTFGDISMFSFHATKLFHTLEGGALTFNSPDLKQRIDLLKNFGIKNEEEVVMPGINGKMNELQAAIGLINLRLIDAEREKRQKIVDAYKQNLAGIAGISVFKIPDGIKNSYQYFVIRIGDEFGRSRDDVYTEFKKYNVFTRKYFYPLCSDYNCYRQLPSATSENLPVAKKVVKEVLCMPLYGGLKLDEVDKICEILKGLKK
ncbi:MAG: DegT/DnrJ/EryC1/StrS family aminotransferase [Candidatus Methanoperedens sp.]|nr:DegT/DnrJ/EryC1/StrS family aminotransferase [Candidatus Methanoperedens sp.]MCZ7404840.1 DegT/DnrJ/EryC1/StrS family aminotransferase [Candidatus Methanoperedens sp.]